MTYQPPTFNQSPSSWKIVFQHIPTGVVIESVVKMPGSTEAQTDAVVQALLDKIATLPNTTVIEAMKTKLATSVITVTA